MTGAADKLRELLEAPEPEPVPGQLSLDSNPDFESFGDWLARIS